MAARNAVVVRARGDDAPDLLIGDEGAVEHRVVALRRPHAERVPRLDHRHAGRGPLDEGVDDLRAAGRIGVDGVRTQPFPGRAVGTELLAARQAIATGHALGATCRQQDRDVVAGLGMTGREHLATGRRLEDPRQRRVAEAFELRGDAGPVEVHRRRQRGGRREAGHSALRLRQLGQVETAAAVVHRHRGREVAELAQLREVLVEVGVRAVELAGPGAEPFEQVGVERHGAREGGAVVHAATVSTGARDRLTAAHSVSVTNATKRRGRSGHPVTT